MQKKFIVSYGITAFNHVPFLMREFKLKDKNTAIIDSTKIITQNEDFQKEIDPCRKSLKIAETFRDVADNTIESCNSIFFRYKITADQTVNNLLKKAVESQKNIIYSFDGRDLEWFNTHDLPIARAAQYDIIIVYFCVDDEEALDNLLKEAKSTGRMMMRDDFIHSIKVAEDNFVQLMNNPLGFYVVEKNKVIFKQIGEEKTINMDKNSITFLPALREALMEKKGGRESEKNYGVIIVIVLLLIIILYRIVFGKIERLQILPQAYF